MLKEGSGDETSRREKGVLKGDLGMRPVFYDNVIPLSGGGLTHRCQNDQHGGD